MIESIEFSMQGPLVVLDKERWPARGDLAHIRLAGICFVTHYAEPLKNLVKSPGSSLHALPSREAPARSALLGDTEFNVLDVEGEWAWGQVDDDGLVGFVLLSDLVLP